MTLVRGRTGPRPEGCVGVQAHGLRLNSDLGTATLATRQVRDQGWVFWPEVWWTVSRGDVR